MLEAVREVNEQLGVTVVIVTHDATVSDHVRRTVGIRAGRTATEVLRRSQVGTDGELSTRSQEYAVLDRVGRLQLPAELVDRLDLADRVRLSMEPGHVGVWPGEER